MRPSPVLDPLTRLAIRHGTDKFGYHDYTPNYHSLFARFRDRPVRVLEIGVGGYQDEDRGGQSLAVWRDYFPQGTITGIDIQKKVLDLGPRVAIRQGSQVDQEFLAQVVAERGPFDLIIDDGSHRNEHVVESWKILWPGLVPGGIYVAEDVQTAFMPRFGGSLSLDPPNSVGFFAAMLGEAGGDSGIAGLERFHNMIALHKAGVGAGAEPRPGLWGSGAWERLEGNAIASVGASVAGRRGSVPVARVDALSGRAPWDAVIVADATPESWRAGFAALGERGLLALPGPLSAAMRDDLAQRFVEVDHREIRVGFPQAGVDPLAPEIYAVEVHPDGALIVKAPNDWPSNFDFDADHPQAAAAIAAIEAELRANGAEENGYVQFANLLTNTQGREAAREWLARLEEIGATARIYYQLAGGLAQKDREFDRAARLFRKAVDHYRGDPLFLLNLAAMEMARGDVEAARAAAAEGIALHPRDANLHLQMARIAERAGDWPAAVDHAGRAVAVTAGARKAQAQTVLGEMLAGAGRTGEAEEVLRAAVAADAKNAARAWRALSGVLEARGAGEEARSAAEKAVELSPKTREYRDWQARLSA